MTTVQTQRVLIDGCEPLACAVSIVAEQIETTSAYGCTKPDVGWTFVDAAGHFHAWAADGTLPTLHVPKKRYRCVICGEKISPRTIYVPGSSFRTFKPGRKEITLQVIASVEPARVVSVHIPDGPMSGFGAGTVRGHLQEGDRFEYEVLVWAWGHRTPAGDAA